MPTPTELFLLLIQAFSNLSANKTRTYLCCAVRHLIHELPPPPLAEPPMSHLACRIKASALGLLHHLPAPDLMESAGVLGGDVIGPSPNPTSAPPRADGGHHETEGSPAGDYAGVETCFRWPLVCGHLLGHINLVSDFRSATSRIQATPDLRHNPSFSFS